MRVVLNGEIFNKIVTACTGSSRKLCRQFCYAVVEIPCVKGLWQPTG